MARGIIVRPKLRWASVFFLTFALPVFVGVQLDRASREVDVLIDDGIAGLDRAEDLMQILLDLRSGIFHLLDVDSPAGDEAVVFATVERDRRLLAETAVSFLALRLERVMHDDEDSTIRSQIERVDSAVARAAEVARDRSDDVFALLPWIESASAEIDQTATILSRVSTRVASRAHVADSAIPIGIRRAEIATWVLAALGFSMAVLLLVHGINHVPTRQRLIDELKDALTGGRLRDATGLALCTSPFASHTNHPLFVQRVLTKSRSRVSFFAILEGDDAVKRVHGVRYSVLGIWSSWLSPWRTSVARSEWNAARALQGGAVPATEPVGFGVDRVFGVPIASTVLTARRTSLERASDLVLRKRWYRRRPLPARIAFVTRLGELVAGAHRVGVFGLRGRNLHVSGIGVRTRSLEGIECVLGALTNTTTLRRAPEFVRRFLARRDRARVAGALRHYLDEDERSAFAKAMRGTPIDPAGA